MQLIDLKSQLTNLEKQLENTRLDKHLSQSSPLSPASVSNDLDGKSKQSHCSHQSWKIKSIKLPDLLMLTDGHAARFDIDV